MQDRSSGRPGARAWWRVIEPVHAVTYFAPESHHALGAAGLRGFWMGYFAARIAPVGAVGPSTVTATFFNFHPSMVRRSIPDAWSFADPATVLAARRRGAATALRRLDPSVGDRAPQLVPSLRRVSGSADGAGRVLFGANRALDVERDPVEALWQACTTLREHRGDGHVAALTAAGLDGCQALVLFALSEQLPVSMFLDSRGWSADEWEGAGERWRAANWCRVTGSPLRGSSSVARSRPPPTPSPVRPSTYWTRWRRPTSMGCSPASPGRWNREE